VLDAGAEIIHASCRDYLYGYRNLTGNNLVFDKSRTKSSAAIAYEYDITPRASMTKHFDAILPLSGRTA
jgi:hypothetical protein